MSTARADDPALALLSLLSTRDGVSLAAAAKKLGLRQSELRRLLTGLGNDPAMPGLGLVEVRGGEGRSTLWLTAEGRWLLDGKVGAGESSVLEFDPETEPSPLPLSRRERGKAEPVDNSLCTVPATRITGEAREAFSDAVIAETPVALLYNGIAFAVMLATPADLADFALGFSLSEGIVGDAGEWRLLERVDAAEGITLDMAIPQARADALADRRRSLAGRSGCGLCGVESLAAALPPVAAIARGKPVPLARVREALAQLEARQPLNRRSGGVHAAAFAHDGGLLVREDVGRHNALDKVLGARAGAGFGDGFLVVTSRASVEMVHKAAACGVGLLVAISAPTSLAIELARSAGLTLVAFARGEAMTVYTHPDRLS